jgi:hypothetical protein
MYRHYYEIVQEKQNKDASKGRRVYFGLFLRQGQGMG